MGTYLAPEIYQPADGEGVPPAGGGPNNNWGALVNQNFEHLAGQCFNVKMYGATGNGSTDDSAAIAAAVTALNAAGGGELFFPHGTYKCSFSGLGGYRNAAKFGSIVGFVITTSCSIRGDAATLTTADPMDFFRVIGDYANYGANLAAYDAAVHFDDLLPYFKAEGLTFDYGSQSNYAEAIWVEYVADVAITHCKVLGSGGNGISIYRCAWVDVSHNVIFDSNIYTLNLYMVGGGVVKNNRFDGNLRCDRGVVIKQNFNGRKWVNLTIEDNEFRNFLDYGVTSGDTRAAVPDVVEAANGVDHWQVWGVIFRNNTWWISSAVLGTINSTDFGGFANAGVKLGQFTRFWEIRGNKFLPEDPDLIVGNLFDFFGSDGEDLEGRQGNGDAGHIFADNWMVGLNFGLGFVGVAMRASMRFRGNHWIDCKGVAYYVYRSGGEGVLNSGYCAMEIDSITGNGTTTTVTMDLASAASGVHQGKHSFEVDDKVFVLGTVAWATTEYTITAITDTTFSFLAGVTANETPAAGDAWAHVQGVAPFFDMSDDEFEGHTILEQIGDFRPTGGHQPMIIQVYFCPRLRISNVLFRDTVAGGDYALTDAAGSYSFIEHVEEPTRWPLLETVVRDVRIQGWSGTIAGLTTVLIFLATSATDLEVRGTRISGVTATTDTGSYIRFLNSKASPLRMANNVVDYTGCTVTHAMILQGSTTVEQVIYDDGGHLYTGVTDNDSLFQPELNQGINSRNRVYFATAVPTYGTYRAGDVIFRSDPGAGAVYMWICTVAGTPGTWVASANL